jgi:hypothetical protein
VTTRSEWIRHISASRQRETYSSILRSWARNGHPVDYHQVFSNGNDLFFGTRKGYSLHIASRGEATISLLPPTKETLRGLTQFRRKTLREIISILSGFAGGERQ